MRHPAKAIDIKRAVLGAAFTLLLVPFAAAVENPAQVYLSGKTLRFAPDDFGSGILYAHPDGTVFLWRPGRLQVTKGTWTAREAIVTRKSKSGDDVFVRRFHYVCFRNLSELRGTLGGKRFKPNQCLDPDEMDALIAEVAGGDVLNLSSGQGPCRLCGSDDTLARLRTKVPG